MPEDTATPTAPVTPTPTPVTPDIQNSLKTLKDSVTDGALKDYANPKAALTIGAMSAMVLAFTATLTSSFPILPAALTALGMSVVFAAAQVYYLNEKIVAKVFYGFIVAMLIFHTAKGGNQSLSEASGDPKVAPVPAEIVLPKTTEAQPWNPSLIPSAYAAPVDVSTNVSATITNANDKFYFSYMGKDGFPVYTNRAGAVYTDKTHKRGIFRSWKF